MIDTDLTHSNYQLNCNDFNIGNELEKCMQSKGVGCIQNL